MLCDIVLAQELPPEGSVAGSVWLADTQAAAAGANVFLVQSVPTPPRPKGDFIISMDQMNQSTRGEFHATADSAGHVEMQHVRPGEYYVVAQVPGYISPENYIVPWGLAPAAVLPRFVQKVVVEAGKGAHFDLYLERGGAIEGRVTYDDDRPAHNGGSIVAEVALSLLVRSPDGSFGHAMVGAAHTDGTGHYRFDALPTASYVVLEAQLGGIVETSRGKTGTQGEIMFSGNTQRLSKAKVIEVKGTSVREADLVIPTTGLHRVTGKVLLPDGKTLMEGTVRLNPEGESDGYGIPFGSRTAPIQVDGSFVFDSVAADTYTLTLDGGESWEFAGLTDDHKGMKMNYKAPLYLPVNQSVIVNGSDPAPVVVQLTFAH